MQITEKEKAFAKPALDIIARRWPDIYNILQSVAPVETLELAYIEPNPTFSLNGIQLASSFDPVNEARLQSESIPVGARTAWVYGVGMGYLPRVLLDEREGLDRLHVYIMNAELFLGLLHWIDQSDWLVDERVVLHVASNECKPRQPMAVTAPCLWLASEESHALRDRLHNVIHAQFANEDWLRSKKLFSDQLEDNRDLLASDGDASVLLSEDRFSGRSMVVVGAGPSLDSVYDRITDLVADGACLVAVDAALRPLLAHGLVPDLVVTIDPRREGVLPNFTGDLSQLRNATLVYFPIVHRDVLLAWPYRRLAAYSISGDYYDEIKTTYPRFSLFSNGSVIHPAIDLAVKAGAPAIYLAGVDFAFTDNRTHAGDVPHGIGMSNDPAIAPHTVKNGHGDIVTTQLNMLGYLRDLEYYIEAHAQVRFVNLSRLGAFIAGTEYE